MIGNLFRGAAEVINDKGWTRGAARDSEGRVCTEQAILCAAQQDVDRADALAHLGAINRAHAAIAWLTTKLGVHTFIWNDLEARDADDVVHTLKRAAEDYEAELNQAAQNGVAI